MLTSTLDPQPLDPKLQSSNRGSPRGGVPEIHSLTYYYYFCPKAKFTTVVQIAIPDKFSKDDGLETGHEVA